MTQADAQGAAPHFGNTERAVYGKATVGFALLYAACVPFYYRSWLFGFPAFADQSAGGVLNIVIVLVSIVLAVYVGMRGPFRGMPCVWLGIAFLLAGSALAHGALSGGWGRGAYVASVVCAAAGMGLSLPCCYELFSRYAPRWIAVAYGLVASGGMLFALAAELLGPTVLLVSNVAFLLASAVLLLLAQREAPLLYVQGESMRGDVRKRSKRPSITWRRLCDSFLVAGVCVFAISMVYGVLSTTATGTDTPRDVSVPMAQVGGLVIGILFLVYFGLMKKGKPAILLFNVVFGIVGAAILLLPFLQSSHVPFLYAFASAAWKLMLLVLVAAASNRREQLVCLALACALPRLGLLVGVTVANTLDVGIESEFTRMTAIAVFFLYLLSMVMWFINSFERKRAEDRAQAMGEMLKRYSETQEDVRALRIESIAEKAELTKREREVLAMMARGRDLAYVCDELCLSRNTVKGYQKSIYAKLGVHSKQEVIDLADCE